MGTRIANNDVNTHVNLDAERERERAGEFISNAETLKLMHVVRQV